MHTLHIGQREREREREKERESKREREKEREEKNRRIKQTQINKWQEIVEALILPCLKCIKTAV
jgi:hypothetical protein